MERLQYTKSELTPAIDFDKEQRLLNIDGRCISENAHTFFTPLISWISDLFEKHVPDKTEVFTLHINCDYYNSASAKMFVYFFDKIAEIQKEGHTFKVIWYCKENDPDMIDSVEDFTVITDVIIDIKKD
jgi:hypothetical protein